METDKSKSGVDDSSTWADGGDSGTSPSSVSGSPEVANMALDLGLQGRVRLASPIQGQSKRSSLAKGRRTQRPRAGCAA